MDVWMDGYHVYMHRFIIFLATVYYVDNVLYSISLRLLLSIVCYHVIAAGGVGATASKFVLLFFARKI